MTADAPDDDGGTDEAETPPVACTLGEDDYQRRKPWMESEFLPLLADVEQLAAGVELTFEGADDTVETVARFVNEEADCCSFARYEVAVEPPYERTTLTITGPEGTAGVFGQGVLEALASMETLPDSLEDLPEPFAERHEPTTT